MVNNVGQQLVKSLLFDVEATPQEHTIKLKSSENTTPLNIKVRVRKKNHGSSFGKKGLITVPRHNQPDTQIERLRLASSEQTIMSFDMLLETDDLGKKVVKKPKRSIFGSCLGGQEDDDDTRYAPSTVSIAKNSMSDTAMTKLTNVVNVGDDTISSTSSRKDKIFGKCKPGGCLDPPFGEDKYAYQPQQHSIKAPAIVIKDTQNENSQKQLSNETSEKLTIIKKEEPKPVSAENVYKLNGNQNKSNLSLYQENQNPGAGVDENDSDFIITYPTALYSSEPLSFEEINEKNCMRRISNASKKSFNELSTQYFSPPRASRISSKNSKKNVLTENILPAGRVSVTPSSRSSQKSDSENVRKENGPNEINQAAESIINQEITTDGLSDVYNINPTQEQKAGNVAKLAGAGLVGAMTAGLVSEMTNKTKGDTDEEQTREFITKDPSVQFSSGSKMTETVEALNDIDRPYEVNATDILPALALTETFSLGSDLEMAGGEIKHKYTTNEQIDNSLAGGTSVNASKIKTIDKDGYNTEKKEGKSPAKTSEIMLIDYNAQRHTPEELVGSDLTSIVDASKNIDNLEEQKAWDATAAKLIPAAAGLGAGLAIATNVRNNPEGQQREMSMTKTEDILTRNSVDRLSDSGIKPTVDNFIKHTDSCEDQITVNHTSKSEFGGGIDVDAKGDKLAGNTSADPLSTDNTHVFSDENKTAESSEKWFPIKQDIDSTNGDLSSRNTETSQRGADKKRITKTSNDSFSEYNSMGDLGPDYPLKDNSNTSYSSLTKNGASEIYKTDNSDTQFPPTAARKNEKLYYSNIAMNKDAGKTNAEERKHYLLSSEIMTGDSELNKSEINDDYISNQSKNKTSVPSSILKDPSSQYREKSPLGATDILLASATKGVILESGSKLGSFKDNINYVKLPLIRSTIYGSIANPRKDSLEDQIGNYSYDAVGKLNKLGYLDGAANKSTIGSGELVFLNLAFEKYFEDGKTAFRTLNITKSQDHLSKVIIIKSLVRTQDESGITIPLDSKNVMKISIMPATVIREHNLEKNSIDKSSEKSEMRKGKISNKSCVSNSALSLILLQELVPLQSVIKHLKQDIDNLALQKLQLKNKLEQGCERTKPVYKNLCNCPKRNY